MNCISEILNYSNLEMAIIKSHLCKDNNPPLEYLPFLHYKSSFFYAAYRIYSTFKTIYCFLLPGIQLSTISALPGIHYMSWKWCSVSEPLYYKDSMHDLTRVYFSSHFFEPFLTNSDLLLEVFYPEISWESKSQGQITPHAPLMNE